MQTAIISIGTAVPTYSQKQAQVVEFMCAALELTPAKKRLFKAISNATGIDYRHSVLNDYMKHHQQDKLTFFPNDATLAFPSTAERMRIYEATALPLALQAIANCLAGLTNFDKNSLTHLITISCTGMYAPGLDIEIVQHLNLPTHIKRTSINFMGCYAAFNGLRLADSICKADAKANILMVNVELCSLHFQKNDSFDALTASAIFSDGASAVVITSNAKEKKQLRLLDFYCDIVPQSTTEMAWNIRDSGFDMILTAYVANLIESGIAELVEKLIAQSQLKFTAIDFFAIHPGGMKILQACEKALNISVADNKFSYEILRNYGNMSSVTVIFVLKAIWEQLTSSDDKKNIFSCAFGPGLTLESALLQIHYQ